MPEHYLLGLIGYPVSHSLSPRLHRAALDACGLGGEYQLYEAPSFPEGRWAVQQLLEKLRCGELHGLNVTIPHKQSVIPLLDELTPTAREIGAVNTIYMNGDRLVGENTDAAGFLADLGHQFPRGEGTPGADRREEQRALVLGAGGSARAVVYALLEDKWDVCVSARRPEQARALASDFQQSTGAANRLSAVGLNKASLERVLAGGGVRLIVQATPAGMASHADGSAWPEGLPLPGGAFLYDLVYNPAQTKLVRTARDAGLPAANGMGMLIEQAALAFGLWTGRQPPRQAMRQALESDYQENIAK